MILTELNAGVLLGKNGMPDEQITLLSPTDDCATWDEAVEFARSFKAELPDQRAQALLKANLPEEFKDEWYWSSEPLRGPRHGCAWAQSFTHGRQAYLLKTDEINVRIIRRTPL